MLILTLNRPEVRNAFDLAMAQCLEAQVDRLDADPSLRAAVLTGGPQFFCAGVDLRAAARGERPRTAARGWFGLIEKPSTKPMVAAVEGPAYGGGFELALACDLIVSSKASQFALPEASRGLIASAGGLIRLPRRLPPAIASEIALTCDPMPADRLHALGLINRLSEPGSAMAVAIEIATRIATHAPLSIAATKRVLALRDAATEAESWVLQEREFESVRGSEDYREGLEAFAQKRKPEFRGH